MDRASEVDCKGDWVLDCQRGNKISGFVVIIQVYFYQLCNHAVFIVIVRFLPPFFGS